MRSKLEWRQARVAAVCDVASDVRQIDFALDGFVPRFDPGSHVNFQTEISGAPVTRTYSCVPTPHPGQIRVAVKLHEKSRGGSRFMWSLKPGDTITMSLPENRFELSWRAPYYLLLAGGIGITPIYGMALTLKARGIPFRLVYGARSKALMAYADDLAAQLGEAVTFRDGEKDEFIDIASEIAALPEKGELYVCGPIPMLNAVKAAWEDAGRPPGRLRYEVFGDSGAFTEEAFEVTVANRDVTVAVRPDQSLLEALMAAGVDMIYDCQRGECGLCAVDVVEHTGEIDHRDVFFSAEEKEEGKRMCACVSRLASGSATIDIGYRP
ncbi:PDR/VanB family oxidoreductase [Pelagibacterium halotolerans]|uniref:PDR/VanB family oxidoreductase n=1 Tax=Pelagibacterium halotolerans TaxID=531813 RepID=UPI00384CC22A